MVALLCLCLLCLLCVCLFALCVDVCGLNAVPSFPLWVRLLISDLVFAFDMKPLLEPAFSETRAPSPEVYKHLFPRAF